jgi:leucyl/phenylalanyl-tRNA--protein transferase
MPDARQAPPDRPIAAGGDLEPGTVLAAYRSGIFPWPDGSGRLLWWSPDPRAILPLDTFHESRSLRRFRRRGAFRVTRDAAFVEVMQGCAARREGTWITPSMIGAYARLHELGWAHSVEVWSGETLAGGVYGLSSGGFFAAESMFHVARDTSKVALVELVEGLREKEFQLLDVQFLTAHLASLGAIEISRDDYLERLAAAIAAAVSF